MDTETKEKIEESVLKRKMNIHEHFALSKSLLNRSVRDNMSCKIKNCQYQNSFYKHNIIITL